jgi:hypothetical protein
VRAVVGYLNVEAGDLARNLCRLPLCIVEVCGNCAHISARTHIRALSLSSRTCDHGLLDGAAEAQLSCLPHLLEHLRADL